MRKKALIEVPLFFLHRIALLNVLKQQYGRTKVNKKLITQKQAIIRDVSLEHLIGMVERGLSDYECKHINEFTFCGFPLGTAILYYTEVILRSPHHEYYETKFPKGCYPSTFVGEEEP